MNYWQYQLWQTMIPSYNIYSAADQISTDQIQSGPMKNVVTTKQLTRRL